jgi:hypothetical protein
MTWCLPYWHARIAQYQADRRKATDCPARRTADAEYPAARFVPCAPDTLRRQAERAMGTSISLDEYALARNLHSERHSGSPEEWAVIGESAMNEARRRGWSVSKLLLYNKFGIYAFGDIVGQGRWASTRHDPTFGEVMAAKFILSGGTQNFARGATSYIDPDQMGGEERLMRWVRDRFNRTNGPYWAWVGQLPGVPVRRTFAMKMVKSLSSQQMLNNQAGLDDLKSRRNIPAPNVVCAPTKLTLKDVVPAAAIAAIGILGALSVTYAVAEGWPRKWKLWN